MAASLRHAKSSNRNNYAPRSFGELFFIETRAHSLLRGRGEWDEIRFGKCAIIVTVTVAIVSGGGCVSIGKKPGKKGRGPDASPLFRTYL